MGIGLIFCIIVFAALVAIAGINPVSSGTSVEELERRVKNNDSSARATLRREKHLGDITSLLRVLQSLLLVVFVGISIAAFGWLVGILLSLTIALEYGALARVGLAQRYSGRLYKKYEPMLLDWSKKYPHVFTVLRTVTPQPKQKKQFDSREELVAMIADAPQLLSADERVRMQHMLSFETRYVKEVMTPRGVVDTVGKGDVLGPLVLDDLHKTGHSRFPVIDGDIDHIVGMLYIQNLLTLDSKKTVTAEKAMDANVFYVREDQTLQHALAAFLRSHHHLFVVVNEFQETVGLLSLEDTLEALIGHKIVDEFDQHDDLRAVAAHNPRGDNTPPKRKDI